MITARLAMEFGREVFGVPGNATQEISFAPNPVDQTGSKTGDGRGRPDGRAANPGKGDFAAGRGGGNRAANLLAENGLSCSQEKIYYLLGVEQPRAIDDLVATSGLNSSEVLATLFELEMKGLVRQLPGKQFSKVLL